MAIDFDRLSRQLTINLTTTGRRSGRARTVEIWWFRVDGRFVITGTPGRRDWLANALADPHVVIGVGGDELRATLVPIADEDFRRRVFTDPRTSWYVSEAELDRLVAVAPMVEVMFDGDSLSADESGTN